MSTASQDPWKDAFPTQKSDFKKFVHPNLKKTISKYNLKLDDVRRLYFNNDDVTMDGLENLVDFFGETHFVEGIHKVVKIQVEKSSSPTYLYQFSFDKIPSPFKLMTKTNIAGSLLYLSTALFTVLLELIDIFASNKKTSVVYTLLRIFITAS